MMHEILIRALMVSKTSLIWPGLDYFLLIGLRSVGQIKSTDWSLC